MAKPVIKGLEQAKKLLAKKVKQYVGTDKEPKVTVGYMAYYAIYVHENLENYHPVGQAKFLSQPARENRHRYMQLVVDTMKKGGSLLLGMIRAGNKLLADSRELVPVDTGFLKNSGFVRTGNTASGVPEGGLPYPEGISVKVSNPLRRIHRKKGK